jgi:hypothetical protein
VLPLAGTPGLTMLGRVVQFVSGYTGLVEVEPSGRTAIVEVKLARNAEARRAILA